MINLYIAGYKGWQVLQLCHENKININCVYFYKSKLNSKFYENIKKICIKNKINFKIISVRNIENHKLSKSYKSFFIGWQFKMNVKSNSFVFHDSLLPSYIGHSPTVAALINGDKRIGISLFKPAIKLDSGKVIYQKEIKIEYPVKIYDVYEKITRSIFEVIFKLINKKTIKFKNKNYKKKYSIWRDEKDFIINWNSDTNYLKRFIDALGYPYDNAETYYNKRKIKIIDCEVIKNIRFVEYHPGKIISLKNNCPIVMCKNGLIKINSSIYENGRKVNYKKLRVRLG